MGREKVAVVSLGCAKNLINSEQMMYLLLKAGFRVTGKANNADVVIINTCGFIESAKTEAIETILEFCQAKDGGSIKKIIVTGCLAERYKNEITSEIPEVDAVVGVGSFDDIVSAVKAVLSGCESLKMFGDINSAVSDTKRVITTSRVWAYMKIAEGCDNRCAFCVIPDIRGQYRSRPVESIVDETLELTSDGIKEIILVAQDVTRYGLDLYGKRRLKDLLTALCAIDGVQWIRLHYLYPDEIDNDLINVVAGNDKILKYLDVPIQHINNRILSRMRRRGSGDEVRALIKRLRERIPGVVLRTSIITGLPGEGEREFEELCAFLKEARIERVGVFQFSPEEGTDAAVMDRPDGEAAERRAGIISEIQRDIFDEFNWSRIGDITPVLVEGREEGRYYGRSFAESPEIDGYIRVKGAGIATDSIIDVHITDVEDGELIGEV